MSNLRVAIKEIPTEKYELLSIQHEVSEADTMRLCRASSYVVDIVDEFKHKGTTYIVSKLVEGGNLLDYIDTLID